jgi:tripartite-type tricarboxylate transporter receptor subunit TctC
MMRSAIVFGASLALGVLPSVSAHAQSVADFYRGKTIDFLVGAAAGGGYDLPARTIASHMSRHIPRQSHLRRAQHGWRSRPGDDQPSLQCGAA